MNKCASVSGFFKTVLKISSKRAVFKLMFINISLDESISAPFSLSQLTDFDSTLHNFETNFILCEFYLSAD